jgi:hypothetical protein
VKKFLRACLALALLAGVWWWLLRHADLGGMAERVAELPAWAWAAAGLGLMAGHLMRALRLRAEWRHLGDPGLPACLRMVLVHNAAVGALKPYDKLRLSHWDLTLESSLRPFWLLTRLCPLAPGASVIGISSMGSQRYIPGYVAMGAAKGGIEALANAAGSSFITASTQDLSLSGSIVSLSATATISTATKASSAISTIEESIDALGLALAGLGTDSKKLSMHKTFIGKLTDELNKGIGNLVDADLAKESARLQALQTKQQLGIQSLSIANQAPSTLLSLFR